MPHYDFRCPKCGLVFDVNRRMSQAADPAPCPDDGELAERVFRAPMAFVRGGAEGTVYDQLRWDPNSGLNTPPPKPYKDYVRPTTPNPNFVLPPGTPPPSPTP
jgi:putative FmdB family regulatory protein